MQYESGDLSSARALPTVRRTTTERPRCDVDEQEVHTQSRTSASAMSTATSADHIQGDLERIEHEHA
jgi:hypothetical protein